MTTRRCPASIAILILIAAAFLGLELTGGSESIPNLLRFGALAPTQVRAGEYWRLVTPIFLHIGWLHLLFNGYALLQLGALCETLLGWERYLLVFLLSGIGGTVASALLNGRAVSAGASGAVFGLGGFLLVVGLVKHARLPELARRSLVQGMLPFIGYNLLFGLINPRIDNMGHLGGLVTGALLGLIIRPGAAARWLRIACATVALATIGAAIGTQAWRGGRIDLVAIDRDVTFYIEFHNGVAQLVSRLAGELSPAAVEDMVQQARQWREKVAQHFQSAALEAERATGLQILDQLIAQLETIYRQLRDASANLDASAASLNATIENFFAWSEQMVAWARAHGYEIGPRGGGVPHRGGHSDDEVHEEESEGK